MIPFIIVSLSIPGVLISTNVDPCKSCIDRSTCSQHGSKQGVCNCMPGYFGENCTDRDECKKGTADPCHHRGVCINTIGSYKCMCLEGWTGTHCTENTTNSTAACMPGYSGVDCKVSACGHGYAKNNSLYANNTKGFTCYCDTGWRHEHEGDVCDSDIDECATDNGVCKNNGTCSNTDGSYNCSCIKPWDGKNCTDYNPCLVHSCQNGGSCIVREQNGMQTAVCSCTPGWKGGNCSDDVDECEKVCVHGKCTNYVGSYNCSCIHGGWTGKNCNETGDNPTTDESSAATWNSQRQTTVARSTLDQSVPSTANIPLVAGVTSGVVVVVIMLGLLGFFIYKRRRGKVSSVLEADDRGENDNNTDRTMMNTDRDRT